MKKRNKRLAIWLVRLLIIGLFVFVFVHPSSRLVIFGLLRGERFYAGKPTSYWRQTLKAEKGQAPQPSPPSYLMSLIKSLPFLPQDDRPYQGAFWELRNGDRSAIPVLIQLLRDDDPEIRMLALQAIEQIGSRLGPVARKEAAPALVEASKDKDDAVRWLAVRALNRTSPENKQVIPMLIETLNDKQNPRRLDAICGLGEIGVDAKDAVPLLIEVLKEDDEFAWPTAAWAVGEIGPDARDAVPALRELLKRTKHEPTRLQVQQALDKISPAARPVQ